MKTLERNTAVSGTFEIVKWEESAYADLGNGAKLTHASSTMEFHGGIEGLGSAEYLLAYTRDDFSSFVGVQRVSGRLDGRQGSCILHVSGDFLGQKETGTWTIIPDSGADDWEGISGAGTFEAHSGSKGTYFIELELLRGD